MVSVLKLPMNLASEGRTGYDVTNVTIGALASDEPFGEIFMFKNPCKSVKDCKTNLMFNSFLKLTSTCAKFLAYGNNVSRIVLSGQEPVNLQITNQVF